MLNLRLPLTSVNTLLSAVELGILENMVFAFGISILGMTENYNHTEWIYYRTVCGIWLVVQSDVLTVMDTEYTSEAPLVIEIHLGWNCLCLCLCLCSILKDRQDIYKVKAKLGGHVFTGAPDIAIQLCHAVPRDCYPSDQLCFTTTITVNQTILRYR